jgi:hypothetical protein
MLLIYRVSLARRSGLPGRAKVLHHRIPEKRGIIPRFPGIEDILDVAELLQRGINHLAKYSWCGIVMTIASGLRKDC